MGRRRAARWWQKVVGQSLADVDFITHLVVVVVVVGC